MLPRSIRWRLPLSYAAIALLATAVLGAVLLISLRVYYRQQERLYLHRAAEAIRYNIEQMYRDGFPENTITATLPNYAFISRTQVRLLDGKGKVIGESSTPTRDSIVTLSLAAPVDVAMLSPEAGTISGDHVMIWSEPPQVASGGAMSFFSVGGPSNFETAVFPDRPDEMMPERKMPGYSIRVEQGPYGYGLRQVEDRPLISDLISDQEIRVPIHDDERTLLGYLELSDGPALGTAVVNRVAQGLLIAGGVATLLAALVGWIISRNMSQPLLLLTDATHRMAAGDLATRVDLKRRDEMGELATAFNQMAARVETTITALKQFVADAAHEINTPITALQTNLEIASDNPVESRAYVMQAQQQLTRLKSLTSQLLDLARLEANIPAYQTVDLHLLSHQVSEFYASRAEQQELNFEVQLPNQPLLIRGNAAQIATVLNNLLDNALKFTAHGSVSLILKAEEALAKIIVQDTGIGIPAQDIPQLFHRFHRGRNAAAYPGSGLGLMITRTIVEQHGGTIRLECVEQGTQVEITLPLLEGT